MLWLFPILALLAPEIPRAAEVLVLSTATQITYTGDAFEIRNQGPGPIWCQRGSSAGLAVGTGRELGRGESIRVAVSGPFYCISASEQVSGAATVVTPGLAASGGTAGWTVSLWDSTSIGSAAAVTSPLLDLSGVRELEVFVDNTQGNGFRDLTLVSFAPDGVTTVDQVLLRRVAWGSAPSGSSYAPGRARGYVGPNPPGLTSGVHVLYEATSTANGTLDTGSLCFGQETDWVSATFYTDNFIATTQLQFNEMQGAQANAFAAPSTGATNGAVSVGPGISGAGLVQSLPVPIPECFKVTSTAAGASRTVHLRISGRGRPPGTFAVQMALPTKAKLQVSKESATGANPGTARVWVVGR
jgi:hypothetical protein